MPEISIGFGPPPRPPYTTVLVLLLLVVDDGVITFGILSKDWGSDLLGWRDLPRDKPRWRHLRA